MACVSKACPEALRGDPFATLRDSAARFLSANGINKNINELNSLFNVVGIKQNRTVKKLKTLQSSSTKPYENHLQQRFVISATCFPWKRAI